MDRRRRVLIAEDNEALRELYRQGLEAQGYQVSLAADGQTAVRLAIADPPDFILLDFQMPGELDGLQVMDRLRAHPKTAEVWMAILSNLDCPTPRAWQYRLLPLTWLIKARLTPRQLDLTLRAAAREQLTERALDLQQQA